MALIGKPKISIQKLLREAWRRGNLAPWEFWRRSPSLPTCSPDARLRKTDDFARTLDKTDVLALLAAKTASGRASWRPRQPRDGPPGAQDGLQTGFLARMTASDGPPGASDGVQTGLLAPTRQPWRQAGLRRLHFSAAHAILP
jgi:hypothetical protein